MADIGNDITDGLQAGGRAAELAARGFWGNVVEHGRAIGRNAGVANFIVKTLEIVNDDTMTIPQKVGKLLNDNLPYRPPGVFIITGDAAEVQVIESGGITTIILPMWLHDP